MGIRKDDELTQPSRRDERHTFFAFSLQHGDTRANVRSISTNDAADPVEGATHRGIIWRWQMRRRRQES